MSLARFVTGKGGDEGGVSARNEKRDGDEGRPNGLESDEEGARGSLPYVLIGGLNISPAWSDSP